MELNISAIFEQRERARYFSGSAAELGDNAGRITWQNSVDASEEFELLSDEPKRDAFRAFALSSGGWNEEEVNKWTDVELNALCLQWIAGDIREGGLDVDAPNWDEYQADSENGQVNGRLFKTADGAVYWSMD